MDITQKLAVASSMGFFLVGLLTGVWKYHAIHRSEDAQAPEYVSLCHRSSLLYAFACLLLERMVVLSELPTPVELGALIALVTFFGLAVSTYALHGWLRDTDNQLRKPHVLGRRTLPPALVHGGMLALILGEVGGFLVLAYGVLRAL